MKISEAIKTIMLRTEVDNFGVGDLIMDNKRDLWLILEGHDVLHIKTLEVHDWADLENPIKIADAEKVIIGIKE